MRDTDLQERKFFVEDAEKFVRKAGKIAKTNDVTETMRNEARRRFCEAEAANALTEEIVWETLMAFVGCDFYTSRGIRFTYSIRGYEIFVDRKEKSVTKATVMLFVNRARALMADGVKITGPKKVGTFGASYLLPVFREIGLIKP